MTRQAHSLYACLADNKGRTVPYHKLARAARTRSRNCQQYLWLLIFNIRDHLPPRQEIINVRGLGYRLEEREPLVAGIPRPGVFA